MKIHHICINVSDAEESLKLYRDVLGFRVITDEIIPEGDTFEQTTLDDIFQVNGAKSRMIIMASKEGTLIELEQAIVPKVQKVPKEQLRYGYVGFSELAFQVDDIEKWFERIKTSEYELQTDYIWAAGGIVRSFIFYDPDGNMVQLVKDKLASS